jgi:two-component system nitrogen regulation response regulator NtrX
MTSRVLIVDDEQNIRRMLSALLEQESYEVCDVQSGSDALSTVERFEPHVVLLDLIMPQGPDGITTLEQMRAQHPELVVIMMSGKATLGDAVRATRLGAFQFLEKPLTPEGVLVAVKAGVDLSRTRAQIRALRTAVDPSPEIVGTSQGIEEVRSLIAQVAPTTARVLITGESGTGKELVARSIHRLSPRSSQPMISVNCAAIPASLLESELFGHERGAFTGALHRRHGKFELADRGTLFLDEIGDLGSDAQAKVLRVLETGVMERVGGERELQVDVRIIVATNRDLARAVGDGKFREDLYYRLNVFPIHVPPLRHRGDDIPLLAEHFAALAAAGCGKTPLALSGDAVKRLRAHHWPGNVRELANLIERLTIITPSDAVSAADVSALLGATSLPPLPRSARRAHPRGLNAAMEEFEAELIRTCLELANGNVADAARRLQTDRANLYRRMRRLGIDPKDTPVSKRH